jgi:hypothetical protein|tara:strand:+ start:19403 stop:19960 length:558 start_codon:yes stop_codon:yes gene_type:complete
LVGNRDQHDVNGSGTTRIRFGRVAYNNPQHITVLAGINKLITLITIAAYIAAALTVLDRHSATLANRSVAVAVASIIAVASSCPNVTSSRRVFISITASTSRSTSPRARARSKSARIFSLRATRAHVAHAAGTMRFGRITSATIPARTAIARAIDPVPSNPSRTHRHVGANGAMARQSASMDARV